MRGFSGFPDGKVRTVPVPEPFFSELLPLVDHAGELKVTLYAFWRLSLKPGQYRFVQREDFAEDELLMQGLAASPRQAQEALDDALERAEARGTLLRVVVEDDQAERSLYFLNSARGREAVEKLTRGEWRPEEFDGAVITLSHVRANVYTLYEQNIGPLTPLISEELRDLAATYPAAWIEDAIRIAVKNNVRRLKYVLAVLERMRTEGRYEQETRERVEPDLSRFDGYLSYIDPANGGAGDEASAEPDAGA
ncbi:MAG: DnaD domain protein [Anaerolineales bacterium]|nr:DnaD domain protein [Anaerolineales bacterium]